MYTTAALIDLHTRTHRAFAKLIEHCAGFDEAALDREFEGFGVGSIRAQLAHALGAERYWIGVLCGELLTENDPDDAASIDRIEACRARTEATTLAYLQGTSDEDLGRPAEFTTWGGNTPTLTPAHVVVRTQTHLFQHQGQITALCRLLGRPVPPGLDFPLT